MVSVYLFDFVVTARFGAGTLFVLAASYIYGAYAAAKKVRGGGCTRCPSVFEHVWLVQVMVLPSSVK